ncbi:spore germination protein [Bacillus sp. FJAT-27251]|uniref:spore germination protein n=1 Tax=Bacillus sp. FJAT-27251 TaxID=1684142 RepID=UPI0006A761A0|nr:spore germination protein [Bacillus sp. FJAT-27251]
MCNQINIGKIYVNGIAQNASINIGKTLHNSHTSNVKLFGANFSMGDGSPASSLIDTMIQDSDISDQGQTENPSSAENS